METSVLAVELSCHIRLCFDCMKEEQKRGAKRRSKEEEQRGGAKRRSKEE